MIHGSEQNKINRIVAATAREAGIIQSLITSDRRDAKIVCWRNAVFYIAHNEMGMSLPVIGQCMNRDHTTVLHGVRRAQDAIKSDRVFAKSVELISRACAPESPEDKIADALIAFKALTDQERQTFLAFIASGRAA